MLTSSDVSTLGASETFGTPRRAQKRLFTSGSGTSKRNLFRDVHSSNTGEPNSGDDSDIGPMSPLALSDTTPNSAANSPRRKFESPLARSGQRPPVNLLRSIDSTLWEMVTEKVSQDEVEGAQPRSPFSVLKMVTKIARHSQRRTAFPAQSELSGPASDKNSGQEIPPKTPEPAEDSSFWNESITETPKRSFGKEIQNESRSEFDVIAESPQKEESPVRMLITPLGSVNKEASLPRLHHRKSLGNMVSYGVSSPTDGKENGLKRTACPSSAPESLKLFRSDVCPSVPKARAALFQERKDEFKLSTKLFYRSPRELLCKRKLPVNVEKSDVRRGQKRTGVRANRTSRGRSIKRRKYGEINAGIGHGVKKPKLKRTLSQTKGSKKGKADTLSPATALTPHPRVESNDGNSREIVNESVVDSNIEIPPIEYIQRSAESRRRVSSPEVHPGKKFFKTNRTLTRNAPATVTVNDTIKLQVSNGKLKLQSQEAASRQNRCKKIRGIDLILDANDLTVDDPEFETSAADGKSIANILKVLEEDWAEDEYDSMESLVSNDKQTSSPKCPSLPADVSMSPASELSSMTSFMNIKDAGDCAMKFDTIRNSGKHIDEKGILKFYPLFNKDFNQSKIVMETYKKVGRSVKRTLGGQLAAKAMKKDDRQYQLDAGQKLFGATQCTECGVVYQIGDPDDESSHRNYHDNMKILKFSGWKHERIVGTDPHTSGRIILVEPGDSKHYWKKVTEILSVIDRDLGLAESRLQEYCNDKIYLYIRDKEIIGVLAAEYVTTGYRMLPGLADVDCCSLESSSVKCGVKVVWTTINYRRQGVATKLMDVLRTTFHFGYIMSTDDVAFSIPTPQGKAFAEKYVNTKSFKVYS